MFAVICLVLASLTGQPASEPERLVATHYFYWYRHPTEHFPVAGDPRTEGHCRRFRVPEKVSYLDPAWHEGEFRAMAASGIDAALPVYWGAPGAYDRPNLRFSRAGLEPMVRALRRIRDRGDRGVKLGLFYDTSTLLNDVRGAEPRGGKADLRTPEGLKLFTGTVVEYFERLPEDCWAQLDGGALVVLYSSGFAAGWTPDLGRELKTAFARRFSGAKVTLVADASWGDIGQDLTTSWGAALVGPQLFPGVAQIGPGYDDAAVPGRSTPVRDREDGGFYRHSWREALAAKPRLVLLETWNEMHEGTEICETEETGAFYLDLTRDGAARFKAGQDAGPPIPLRFPEPRARPDRSWGEDARGRTAVSASFAAPKPFRAGLREVAVEDGRFEIAAGRLCTRGITTGRTGYLYFQVADAWKFETDEELELEVAQEAGGALSVEFDSRDGKATLHGAYTPAAMMDRREAAGRVTWRFRLPHARLANRQNGGADFRLVVRDGDAAVSSLTLR